MYLNNTIIWINPFTFVWLSSHSHVSYSPFILFFPLPCDAVSDLTSCVLLYAFSLYCCLYFLSYSYRLFIRPEYPCLPVSFLSLCLFHVFYTLFDAMFLLSLCHCTYWLTFLILSPFFIFDFSFSLNFLSSPTKYAIRNFSIFLSVCFSSVLHPLSHTLLILSLLHYAQSSFRLLLTHLSRIIRLVSCFLSTYE